LIDAVHTEEDHTWPRHPRHIFAINGGRCV
jgi:hypothetical protein